MTSFDLEEFSKDYFALFGLERRQGLDELDLETRYRDIQTRVHPDKHAHLGESEQRIAMQWASRANEAYLTLKNPLKRGDYLLRLLGHDPQVERNTAMPMDFLMAQMEKREAVAEARQGGDVDALDRLHRELRKEIQGQHAELAACLDQRRDYGAATELVRQLMFQEKLLQEIDEALAATET